MAGELREQCRKLGIELLQPDPVVASSICKARMKVDENFSLDLNLENRRSCNDSRRWNGHRIHAVEGSRTPAG